MKNMFTTLTNQNGSILFTVIAFVVALTAAAVTMINMTTFELEMAKNYKCQQEAFYNGESAMAAMGKAVSMMVDEGIIADANATGQMGGIVLSQDAMDEGITSMDEVIEDGSHDEAGEGDNVGVDGNETMITKKTTIKGQMTSQRTDGSDLGVMLDADVNWYRTTIKANKGGSGQEMFASYGGRDQGRSLYFRIVSQGHGCVGSANYTVTGQYRHVVR